MASYQEELAHWRAQRKQAQIADRLEQIQQEHAQAARERDVAIANNDLEEAELRDMDVEQLEQEYQQIVGPQRPQMHPASVEFLQKNRAFRERHGAAADQAILMAHNYATRPRNPTTNNPAYTGMGLTPNTPQYFQAVRDLLTMYARDHGLTYDPNEETLTPTEAAKISGTSPQTYNNASRELARDGRFSSQQKR
jgi:hypothetical protein